MGISLANLVIILVIILLIFGAGKLPKVMGELGKGLKNFKDGLKAIEDKEVVENKLIENKKEKKSKK